MVRIGVLGGAGHAVVDERAPEVLVDPRAQVDVAGIVEIEGGRRRVDGVAGERQLVVALKLVLGILLMAGGAILTLG